MAGVIVDASPLIWLERRGFNPRDCLRAISRAAGTDDISVSVIAYGELVLGIYRADSLARAERRRQYLRDIFEVLPVHPYSRVMAEIAAHLRGEAIKRGDTLPFADALIASAAVAMERAVLTTNVSDFDRIPNLQVIPFNFA